MESISYTDRLSAYEINHVTVDEHGSEIWLSIQVKLSEISRLVSRL